MGYIAHFATVFKLVSAAQLRAGRGLLGLSSQEMAKLAGVGWSTIKRFEEAEGIPITRGGTLERLVRVMEAQGVEFLGDPEKSPGVQLKKRR